MMKRFTYLIILIAIGGLVFAQGVTGTQSVVPKDPKSMGMGGSFRVFSTGYDSFFGNPAGFATPKGSLTISDVAVWAYFKPTQENIDKAMAIAAGETTDSQTTSYITDWVITNGLGAGVSYGLGWAGKGFGLGVTLVSDNVAWGGSFLSAKLRTKTQATAVAGIGLPFSLGPVKFRVGADARAYYLLNSPVPSHWPFSTIATPLLSSGDVEAAVRDLDIVGGYGFAFDAGLTIGIGPLSVGALVRDYGLEFAMQTTKVGTLIDEMMVPLEGTEPYILNPTLAVGSALQFNFGKVLAPSLYVEAEDVLSLMDDGIEAVWTKLHAGAELKLFNFIALRGGLNKGWVSVGAGIDLLFLEIDAALFTEETGINPGDSGRSGLALQVALRL
jgi:hypothetical protein